MGDVVFASLESWNPDVVLSWTLSSLTFIQLAVFRAFSYIYRVYDTNKHVCSRVLLCKDFSDIRIIRIESSNERCAPLC